MSALSFENVRKTFGPTVALEGLDLAVKPGELISLLGPSGCGKTTALRIAAGFERADHGVVMLGGDDISQQTCAQAQYGHGVSELQPVSQPDSARSTSISVYELARWPSPTGQSGQRDA